MITLCKNPYVITNLAKQSQRNANVITKGKLKGWGVAFVITKGGPRGDTGVPTVCTMHQKIF